MKNTENTTRLGLYIVETASDYIDANNICMELGKTPTEWKNRADCLTDLKCEYNGKIERCDSSKIGNEAYCAQFVFVVLYRAFEAGNYPTTILNKIKTAGAKLTLTNAQKNGIKVDKNPTPGSIYYKVPTAPGSSGHVGIVVGVFNDRIHTIEANATFVFNGTKFEGIWGKSFAISDINKQGMQFIHIEDFFQEPKTQKLKFFLPQDVSSVVVAKGDGFGVNMAGGGIIPILLLSSVGLGLYFTQNKKGQSQLKRFKKKVKFNKFKV